MIAIERHSQPLPRNHNDMDTCTSNWTGITQKFVSLLILVFVFSQSAYAGPADKNNFAIDCFNGKTIGGSKTGKIGQEKIDFDFRKPSDIYFFIENETCNIDYGNQVIAIPLKTFGEKNITCSLAKKDVRGREEHRIETWDVEIDRMSGKLKYDVVFDVLSRSDDHVLYITGNHSWDCKSAKQKF
jgi:hypothetical protein